MAFVTLIPRREFEETGAAGEAFDLIMNVKARFDVNIYVNPLDPPPLKKLFIDLFKNRSLDVDGAPVTFRLIGSDLDEYLGVTVDIQHIDVTYMLVVPNDDVESGHESEVDVDTTGNPGVFDE